MWLDSRSLVEKLQLKWYGHVRMGKEKKAKQILGMRVEGRFGYGRLHYHLEGKDWKAGKETSKDNSRNKEDNQTQFWMVEMIEQGYIDT